ncbi:MAG: hypothetical protein GX605_12420, partial [Chloroflexi bacterium]|nr:hypothetical protein [Chloroflexota bacterium]
IALFLRQDWLPGAVATVGTIVQGAGIKWVLDRRNEASQEELDAYKQVDEACQNTSKADAFKGSLRLF